MATGVESPNPVDLSPLDLSGTTHTGPAPTPIPGPSSDDSNYFIAARTVIDAINKANANIVVTGYGVTYDGTAHTATGTATGVK